VLKKKNILFCFERKKKIIPFSPKARLLCLIAKKATEKYEVEDL
jgi:hypothetical protein